jgi:DNA-binding XRE family transcriptional regulator
MAVMTTNRIGVLREKLGVTQKVLARMLGVTERTVIDLEGGRALSEGMGRRVTELDRLQRDLSKVVRRQVIGKWLMEPQEAFEGEMPADLIAKGKVDLLWRMIFELQAGVSS